MNENTYDVEAPVDIEDMEIDGRIYDLYDKYCHGFMSRRDFLKRASAITVAGVSGLTSAHPQMMLFSETANLNPLGQRQDAE